MLCKNENQVLDKIKRSLVKGSLKFKRGLLIGLSLIFFATYFSYSYLPIFLRLKSNALICYKESDNHLAPYANDHKMIHMFSGSSSERTIFFLEPTCKGTLNSRQACAIESAARANPEWRIIVFTAGPLTEKFFKTDLYGRLVTIENIQFLRLWVADFTYNSTLDFMFSQDILFGSSFPVEHTSDALRLLILHKYGGIYLDLDVIVVKSFDTLPENFIAKEEEKQVGNFILGLSKEGIGNLFSDTALTDLADDYEVDYRSDDGPHLILATLEKICDPEDIRNMSAVNCLGIEVFDPKYFSPVTYPNWKEYYADRELHVPDAYIHHLWNSQGYNKKIPTNSLYARLAKKHCPSIYQLYGVGFGD